MFALGLYAWMADASVPMAAAPLVLVAADVAVTLLGRLASGRALGPVDVAYETPMAIVNRHLAAIETVFLLPDPAHALVSSSLVRQVAALGGDVSPFVPGAVARFLDTGARDR